MRMSSNLKWTWERIETGQKRSIAIQNRKGGFTCNILTNAAGDIKLLQFIFQGTSRMFVDIPESDRILQCARTGSHYQDSSTWTEFLERFLRIVRIERQKNGDPDATAVLIIDGATQHLHTAAAIESKNCKCIQIPAKMTHVFQPADQFVHVQI